jgi:uncharacterized alkaline shock family protein YloU
MDENEQAGLRAPGKTTIAPGVLVTIARLTTLSVPGVAGMASIPSGMNRFFRRTAGQGVEIEIHNGTVAIDLYLIINRDTYVRDVSRKVQEEVARAIKDMVGMEASKVDIHIVDVDYSGPQRSF